MPNWCANTVVLKHADPEMIARAKIAFNKGELLQEFIPCPQELRDAVANFATNEAMVAKYGYSSWYDFNIANWGTKWDIGGEAGADDIEGGLMLSFDSAWSPPITAYGQLMDLGFEIQAMYYEPGMAFCGIWEDGSDDCYEYGGMNADEIEAALPVELDEAFGISQAVSEWEQEQEEEEQNEQD